MDALKKRTKKKIELVAMKGETQGCPICHYVVPDGVKHCLHCGAIVVWHDPDGYLKKLKKAK
jgi:hypothetical protein